MYKLILVLIGFGLLACKAEMTKEQHLDNVQTVAQSNIEHGTLADGWYAINTHSNEFYRRSEKSKQEFYIDPKPLVLPTNFAKMEHTINDFGKKTMTIYFDEHGAEAWRKATRQNVGLQVIFILDNEIASAPLINEPIDVGICSFWKESLTKSQWEKLVAYGN